MNAVARKFLFVFFILIACRMNAADSTAVVQRVYLVPGQGSDSALFKNIHITGKEVVKLNWILPEKNETMNSFARRMAVQIDTTLPFVIVGVSLGGMIACEMSTFLHPVKVIIISSASGRNELPVRYRFMKYVPVYEIIPAGMIKAGAKIAQPLFEPDRNNEKATCVAMLKRKDKLFLKRTIHCIVNWQSPEIDTAKIIHIHGDNDHTIPLRNVKANYIIRNGSHMMTLTKGKELSDLLNSLLQD